MKGKELEDNKIKILLSLPKPKYQSLGMGLHNNVFYYGIKIYEEDKGYDAIVTSNKKIYVNWPNNNQIKKEFGLNYRYGFFDDLLDYSWENKSVNDWLYNNKLKIPTFKEIFDKIVSLNKKFMWYVEEINHYSVALDIMASYFLELFETRGRTLIVADIGSGKTRQSQIYQLLVFSPIMSPDWTKSSLFRTIESTKGTPIVDNFDNINEELKNDIMTIYKVYKKGPKSIRTEGEKARKPIGFDLFCSMVLNNILGLEEVDENRSNKIRLLKCTDKDIVNIRLNEKDPIWSEIRNNLFILGLSKWKEVRDCYLELKEDKFIGRELERISPQLTIAKLVSKDVYEKFVKFELDKIGQEKINELEDDWVYLALRYAIDTLGDEQEKWIKVKDMSHDIATTSYRDLSLEQLSKQEFKIGIKLGKVFKNNPLFRGRQVGGNSEYLFKRDNLRKFWELKDYPIDNSIKLFAVNTKHTPTSSTTSTNSTNSTNSTKQVGVVGVVGLKGDKDG